MCDVPKLKRSEGNGPEVPDNRRYAADIRPVGDYVGHVRVWHGRDTSHEHERRCDAMTDPIGEINQALYTATPAERQAMLRDLIPTVGRWVEESCRTPPAGDLPSRQWLDEVAHLIEPVHAAVERARSATP
ncbi:hypothetical protein [Jiangella asiatica]|uniref:Uncharacterized protein n=1 Tax=Jiangella asiatica TaxID=2530372 RepID=A0A4R5CL54_9ACTN|nr:hypothetical protein [Jiangella asiatica]TDD99939.1 hypothetical protein E1269_27175 [Jiangella asiatica]